MSDEEHTTAETGDGTSEENGDGAEFEQPAEARSRASAEKGETEAGSDSGPESDVDSDADSDAEPDLVSRVREVDDDLADAVGERLTDLEDEREALQERLAGREEEVGDLTARLKRAKADFQNYKKRAKKRQKQVEERATEDLVTRLVDVRDNLLRAVESDHEDVASIREGVEMTLREFDRILEGENVSEIDPDPGTTVDPQRHEVMMQVDSDQPANSVAEVYRAGYEMGGKVIRAAQVTVSDGSGNAGEATDEEPAGE